MKNYEIVTVDMWLLIKHIFIAINLKLNNLSFSDKILV